MQVTLHVVQENARSATLGEHTTLIGVIVCYNLLRRGMITFAKARATLRSDP